MKAIGRVFNISYPQLAAAALLLVLLISLSWVEGLAHASNDPARPGANSSSIIDRPSLADQTDNNGFITPMPVADRADPNLPAGDQNVPPFLSDLFLIIFGLIGTILAVGPLVLAAIMDIQSTHRS